MNRFLFPLITAAALVALAAGCTANAESVPPDGKAGRAAGLGARVEVAEVQPTAAALDLSLTGEVEGAEDARLASALGGYVESVRVRSGDTVQKGQLLVAVDRALYGAAYDQAKAQRDLAETELGRLEQMGDAVSPSQVSQAATQLAVAEASLKQASVRLRRASVVAPFAGVVSDVAVSEGEVAGPGNPVVRLVQLDPVKVIAQISDRDVVTLTPGMPAIVSAAAIGTQLTGEVVQVSPIGNGNTRSFEVEISVDNPDRVLLPGMVTRVSLTRDLGQEIVLPQDWVISKREGHGVFVESGGTASWTPVTLGQVLHNQVIVEDGLQPGQRVIMTGHRELLDGDEVLVAREGVCCTDGRVSYTATGE